MAYDQLEHSLPLQAVLLDQYLLQVQDIVENLHLILVEVIIWTLIEIQEVSNDLTKFKQQIISSTY